MPPDALIRFAGTPVQARPARHEALANGRWTLN